MTGDFCETSAVSTLAIVQARMTSSRFPGKVLAPLAGQPMVIRQLERIQRATTLDGIVVATSRDPSDDELALAVEAFGVPVVRGSLDDVLARFIAVIDVYEPATVVRLTADLINSSRVFVNPLRERELDLRGA